MLRFLDPLNRTWKTARENDKWYKSIVECETCGCMIKEWKSFQGRGKIIIETFWVKYINGEPGGYHGRKEILKPCFYCKIHKKNKVRYCE